MYHFLAIFFYFLRAWLSHVSSCIWRPRDGNKRSWLVLSCLFLPVSLATVACSSLIVYTVRTNSDTLKYTGQKSNVDLQSTSRPTVTQGTMRTTALEKINTMSSKLTMWEQRWQIVEFVNFNYGAVNTWYVRKNGRGEE